MVLGRGGKILTTALYSLVGFVLLIAIWQLGAARVDNLPAPSATFTKLQDLLSEPFYNRGPDDKGVGLRMIASLQRVFAGFGLAVAVGVPVGLLIGASKRAWQMFNPVIQVLRPVSPAGVVPHLARRVLRQRPGRRSG